MGDEQQEKQVVEIPVWFLKLCGFFLGLVVVGAISWVTWVSANMLEIKAKIGAAAELKAQVDFVQNEVVELKLALERLKR